MATYFEDQFNSVNGGTGFSFRKPIGLQAPGVVTIPTLQAGVGAPTVAAAQGSLYLRTDGNSTSTRLYVNTNGGTVWTPVTTGI